MAENKLQQETIERLAAARRWKQIWLIDFIECYFFAQPHRQRQILSQTKPPTQRLLDAAELNTAVAFLLTDDFVTEIVNTYMPEAQLWCERGPGMFVPKQAFDQIRDKVREQDKHIFEAMKSSNLYSELPKAFNPDLAIGTTAMWIDRRRPHLPIEVMAVPLRELEINQGPGGLIDDRFVVRWTKNRYVRALLPKDCELPEEVAKGIEDKPDNDVAVTWGFWRLWDREDDEWWQHTITIGAGAETNRLVHDREISGEGCCPLIVGRFGACADWPWGLGPLIKCLPELRQVDELDARKIEAVDRNINGPIGYPDDTFTHVEQGLENGMAYPMRPGSEGALKPIYPQINVEPAVYEIEEKVKLCRKLHFIDHPEQTGDTPPTLGQWLDELARAQRRIGTPGMSFWREIPAQIFVRYKYLLEKAGALQPLKVDGRAISLRPYNPSQRAAEQQEIATAQQFAQIMAQMFPEEWRMAIDGRLTMQAFLEKMRVSGLIKMRDQQKVAEFVKQIAPLIMARKEPGASVPQQAGAPAAAGP